MAQIVHPVKGRLQVRLPYRQGKPRFNFHLLRDICGDATRPEYNSQTRVFEVARDHMRALVEQLPNALGMPVEVVLHGAIQTRCSEPCWTAERDSWWTCICGCAGSNHGSGHPLAVQPTADFSISTEYTTQSWMVYPDL